MSEFRCHNDNFYLILVFLQNFAKQRHNIFLSMRLKLFYMHLNTHAKVIKIKVLHTFESYIQVSIQTQIQNFTIAQKVRQTFTKSLMTRKKFTTLENEGQFDIEFVSSFNSTVYLKEVECKALDDPKISLVPCVTLQGQ